jgi:hypothetical protein
MGRADRRDAAATFALHLRCLDIRAAKEPRYLGFLPADLSAAVRVRRATRASRPMDREDQEGKIPFSRATATASTRQPTPSFS